MVSLNKALLTPYFWGGVARIPMWGASKDTPNLEEMIQFDGSHIFHNGLIFQPPTRL